MAPKGRAFRNVVSLDRYPRVGRDGEISFHEFSLPVTENRLCAQSGLPGAKRREMQHEKHQNCSEISKNGPNAASKGANAAKKGANATNKRANAANNGENAAKKRKRIGILAEPPRLANNRFRPPNRSILGGNGHFLGLLSTIWIETQGFRGSRTDFPGASGIGGSDETVGFWWILVSFHLFLTFFRSF